MKLFNTLYKAFKSYCKKIFFHINFFSTRNKTSEQLFKFYFEKVLSQCTQKLYVKTQKYLEF